MLRLSDNWLSIQVCKPCPHVSMSFLVLEERERERETVDKSMVLLSLLADLSKFLAFLIVHFYLIPVLFV